MRTFIVTASIVICAVFAVGAWSYGAETARAKRWLLVSYPQSCCIDVYPTEGLHPKLADKIHFSQLIQQGVDHTGKVYAFVRLPNRKFAVQVFPPRSKTPTMQFLVPGSPGTMAVGSDGTVYFGGTNDVILVYPPGAKRPRLIRIADYGIPGTVTALRFDGRTGILYFNQIVTASSIHDYSDAIYWVLPGSKTATGIIGIRWGSPGFIDTDSEGRVIVSLNDGVAVYCPNPWRRCRFLAFFTKPRGVTYDADTDRLYVGSDLHRDVDIYNYKTGFLVNSIASGFVAQTMTLSPVLP